MPLGRPKFPHRRTPPAVFAAVLAAFLALFGVVGDGFAQAPAPTPAQPPSQAPSAAPEGAPAASAVSGQPLPRFVSLRAGEVNMRSGPGVQYPVDWVYKRRYLPVEVIAAFQTWRKVRDHQGTQGWVHQSMLGSDRTAIVLGRMRTVRAAADANSRALAKLEPDVIIQVLQCPDENGWCRVRASGFEGWLRRVEIWGIRSGEIVK